MTLADEVELEPAGARPATRSSARAWRARTSPPRRCGASAREPAGTAPPVRLRIDKRIPVAAGMARRLRRRGRGAAARRPRGGHRRRRAAARDRRRAGRRRPRAGAPAALRWPPARASASTPLPRAGALRRARAPVARASCRPPTSTARPTAWACRATRPGLAGQAARGLDRRGRPARRAARQRPRARRARAVPGDRRRARDGRAAPAPAARWCAARARRCSGCSPTCRARAARPRALADREPRPIAVAPLGGDAREARLARLRRRPARASSSGAGAGSSRHAGSAARWSPPRARSTARPRPPPEPRAPARSTSARRSARGPTCSSAPWPSSRPARSSGSSRRARRRCCSAASSPARARSTSSTLIAIVWACGGRRRPHELLPRAAAGPRLPRRARRHGSRSPRSACTQVERFFDRHGGKAILIGRFVGLVRAIAPFLAGSSRDAAAALPALRRHRRRPLGLDASSCWATSSGRASATLVDYAKKGALALGDGRSCVVVGDRRGSYRWLREEEQPRGGRRLAGRAGASGPRCGPLVARAARRRSRAARGARRASSGTASPPASSGSSSRRCWRSRRVGAFAFVAGTSSASSQTRPARRATPHGAATWPTGCTPTRP